MGIVSKRDLREEIIKLQETHSIQPGEAHHPKYWRKKREYMAGQILENVHQYIIDSILKRELPENPYEPFMFWQDPYSNLAKMELYRKCQQSMLQWIKDGLEELKEKNEKD